MCNSFDNRLRAHQGFRTQGRTPYQALLEEVKYMQENLRLEGHHRMPEERLA